MIENNIEINHKVNNIEINHKVNNSEINHKVIKLLVGIIAILLAIVTSFLSHRTILSISESYHYGGWARDVFVGSLFAVAAFMAAYNGFSPLEKTLSKIAALAALGVAMFPCECGNYEEVIPRVHGISAAVMFGILAALCYLFYDRAKQKAEIKGYKNANRRAWVYVVCGVAIALSITILLINNLLSNAIINKVPRLVFYCEATALVAFGIAWISASHAVRWITDEDEWLFQSRNST